MILNVTARAQQVQWPGCGRGLAAVWAVHRYPAVAAVYPALAARLESAGLPLYAQHIDQMNLQTLLAMFTDPVSCLLGTDAVRDGIDVPGPPCG